MFLFQSQHTNFKSTIKCSVFESLSELPQFEFKVSESEIPLNSTQLSDPQFFKTNRIQILFSADLFFTIMLSENIQLANGLIFQNTQFGYVVSGVIPSSTYKCNHFKNKPLLSINSGDKMEELVSKFWETEKVREVYNEYSSEQEACEEIFVNSVKLIDKQIYVSLPLKQSLEDINLGDSFSTAFKRFENLERRFKCNKIFFDKYKELAKTTQL